MITLVSGWLDQLVRDHMRSEWVNHGRALNEPQSREDLLCGASLHSYENGTYRPTSLFMDAERTTLWPSPVIFSSHGEIGGCFLPVDGCVLRVVHQDGKCIADRWFDAGDAML